VDVETETLFLSRIEQLILMKRFIRCPLGRCWNRRNAMRVFIVACLVVGIVAVGTAAVLDGFVQASSTAAFTEPGVRV
jgi:hypothetical protein